MDPGPKLIDLAAAIADGAVVEWPPVPAAADDPSQAVIANLRVLEQVASVHATLPPAATFVESLHSTAFEEPAGRWGPLEIIRKIGTGAHADVYFARDPRLNRPVALKLLRYQQDASDASALIDEASLLARVRHANVVTVYGADRIDGRTGIWMEYVDGRTLEQELRSSGPFSAAEIRRVGVAVAEALTAVHAAGLVHRDVKAQNVLRGPGGRVLLSDFGTGRDAGTGASELAGTPLYLAPEVLTGVPADARSDLYSLGVLLFHLATGVFPVVGRSIADLRDAHGAGPSPTVRKARPDLPRALAACIDRALSRDPDSRFESAAAVERALVAAVPSKGRRVRVWTGLVVAGLLLLAGVALALSHRDSDIVELGPQTRLVDDTGMALDPEISPDGRFLAFSAGLPGHMQVEVREIATGRTTVLTDGARGDERRPRWSPDGTRVLFSDGDTLFTRVTAKDVGAATAVARSAFIRSADWTPDGKSILFLAGDTLFRVAAAGGPPVPVRPLDVQAFSLSISPDGSRIAYASGNPDFETATTNFANIGPSAIYVAPLADGPPTEITDQDHLNTSPIWSPDGRALFFISDREGRRDIYEVRLNAVAPHGEAVRLTTGLDAHTIAFSPDGRVLAYSLLTRRANIWSVGTSEALPATSRDVVPVTSGNQTIEEMRVSGGFLYFDSDLYGHMNLYRVPISGGQPERLTRDSWDEFVNAVSPDGQTLAFHAFRNGRREVFVMPAGGGPARFVGVGQSANWSPDGSRVVFASNRQSYGDPALSMAATWSVAANSTQGLWTSLRQLKLTNCYEGIDWRPDGRSFLGVCQGGIQILAMDGSVLRTVYGPKDSGSDPIPKIAHQSPDGRTIYFKSYDADGRASFWSIPAAGGAPRLLVRLGDAMRPSNRTPFDTDGKKLYFTLDERQSDVWVVDVRKGGR